MKNSVAYYFSLATIAIAFFFLSATSAKAQTDADAIMMKKNNFCTGAQYQFSTWKNYWEGILKRNNENLGNVSTQSIAIMGNYGIKDNLNLIVGVPYVQTKATAGQLKGQKGIQDLSLWIKWMPLEKQIGPGTLSLYTIGGYSLPLTNYIADFLPLSIGLRSKSISMRGMADYQWKSWFITMMGTYIQRSNITIDRTAYYTTELNYTNEVKMPNATQWQVRCGYRSSSLIAEAILDNWTTHGGFDISRNNMPFPSNRMNATRIGFNAKYETGFISGLAIVGGANYTVSGRNMGQSSSVNAGVFYLMDFTSKKAKNNNTKSSNKN